MPNTAVALAEDSGPKNKKATAEPAVRPVIAGKEQPAPQPAVREKIKVVGVGGGGNNALDHIIRNGAQGVEFLAVNTDAHCLEKCLSVEKLVIGEKLTKGHGAGSKPEVGENAARESKESIRECLKGCDMVYITAGMGGGTGTGAAPVIAEIAKEMNILTVAVVTKPFNFEGQARARYALAGIEKLKEHVDALIVVPNQRLIELSQRSTTLQDAFSMADNVLRQAVQGVTDLITKPGYINVDFADLRAIMKHAGGAVMGIGVGQGEFRAGDALKRAMESPLMETSIAGAKGVILNVTAHPSVGIIEVQEAAMQLQDMVDEDAIFVWGLVQDESMGEDIQMVVIATGFAFDEAVTPRAAAQKPQKQPSMPAAETQRVFKEDEPLFEIESSYDTPAILRKRTKF